MGCYVWYSDEGTGRGPSPPRPLIAAPNVTAHPSTASVPITVLLYNGPLLCCFNVPIKGLKEVDRIYISSPHPFRSTRTQYLMTSESPDGTEERPLDRPLAHACCLVGIRKRVRQLRYPSYRTTERLIDIMIDRHTISNYDVTPPSRTNNNAISVTTMAVHIPCPMSANGEQ